MRISVKYNDRNEQTKMLTSQLLLLLSMTQCNRFLPTFPTLHPLTSFQGFVRSRGNLFPGTSFKKSPILLVVRIILLLLPLTHVLRRRDYSRHVSCDGYFYTRHFTDTLNGRFRTPVQSVNAPALPTRHESTGKAEPSFNFRLP